MAAEIDKAVLRKVLFTPCKTKEDLARYIKIFLGLDLPDCTVDPESNSNPMDLIFSVYNKTLLGDDDTFSGAIYYSSRDGMKTLSSSVIQLLFAIHFDFNAVIAAAIEAQAVISTGYIKDWLNKPHFREFITTDNERMIELTHYEHSKNGEILTQIEYQNLAIEDQANYIKHSSFIKIVVATVKSMNGNHIPLLCVDGRTKLLSEHDSLDKEGRHKRRKSLKAAGVFNSLCGINPTGRRLYKFDKFLSKEDIKKDIKLLTLNYNTGKLEFKKIIGAARTYQKVKKIQLKNGKQLIASTKHPIFIIGKGFIPLDEVELTDKVAILSKSATAEKGTTIRHNSYESIYKESKNFDIWEQVLIGSLLGNCDIYKKPHNSPYISENHGVEQKEYLSHKRAILSTKLKTRATNPTSGYTGQNLVGFSSGNTPLLLPYTTIRQDLKGMEKAEAMALAYWYMDDGCAENGFRLSTEGWDLETNWKIADFWNTKFGFNIKPSKYERNGQKYWCLSGGVEDKRRLVEICGRYIHPTMAYKFNLDKNISYCKYCNNKFFYYENKHSTTCNDTICQLLQAKSLLAIDIESISDSKDQWVYDFTMEDNHNFWGNGFLNKNCLDELDIAPEKPIQEGKMMLTPGPNGRLPVLLMTSTRKYAFGPVQKEINRVEAGESSLKIFHWNIIDVTQPCPASRHKPEKPKVNIYLNLTALDSISEEKWQSLPTDEQSRYIKTESFAGCATCKLYPVCRGRLATDQKCKSKLLKPIPHVINLFKSVDPESARAQLMCWKPGSEGLIYPKFDPNKHVITASQMAEKITGEEYPLNLSKKELINIIQKEQLKIFCGMDFGYTHFFAVVTAALLGNTLFIFDVIAAPHLEDTEKVEICDHRIKYLSPTIFPDPASPQTIKLFRKNGYICKNFKKDVLGGIETVRRKLSAGINNPIPELFILKYDEGCDGLIRTMKEYHWITDAAGNPTDTPDEKDDDRLDALRYLCQNLFTTTGQIRVGEGITYSDYKEADLNGSNWLANEIRKRVDPNQLPDESISGGKGGFKFQF